MSKPDPDKFAFLGDYEPTPEPLLRNWTFRLESGETGPAADGIARRLIQDFCHCAWTGHTPEPATLEWLANRLSGILDNGKPAARQAFSLDPKPRGGAKQTGLHIQIAYWVAVAKYRGYEEPDAKKQAAALFHKDEKTIHRAWKECSEGKGWGFADNEHVAEYFKLIDRPLPPEKRRTRKE